MKELKTYTFHAKGKAPQEIMALKVADAISLFESIACSFDYNKITCNGKVLWRKRNG